MKSQPLLSIFLACAIALGTAVAQVTTVPVEIQSVDTGKRTITVRFNSKVSSLSVSPNAEITVDGRATDLTSMIPGGRATVEFDKAISAVTKIYAQRVEIAPAEALADGWEQIDQRLLFLMVRLVDVEANLEAIDNAMLKDKGRAGMAAGRAKRAAAGNQRMDRRAGGPVRWDKFYGTTAEKFFYHPTDNHTYHTRTILGHQSPGRDNQTEPGVPSRQGLPVHQRPPQFDYMYRANETARQSAEADIAKFRGNVAALAARHHDLQLEQSKLWAEVAFRAVARNDLDRKNLYRFVPSGTGKEDLLAASKFVVTALSIVTNGQKDQASTFRQIKPLIRNARYELGNEWSQLGVRSRDRSTDEWKFVSLARRLEDVSANLGDSYTVSVERESAGDADRRDMYRGLLQKALIRYAETVLALDEMASEMAKAKGYEPDFDKPVAFNSSLEVPGSSGMESAADTSMSEQANASPRNGSLADLIPDENVSEVMKTDDSEPKSTIRRRSSSKRQRFKTVQYIFNNPKSASANWDISGRSQFEGGGLRIYGGAGSKRAGEPGGVTLLKSKHTISGDAAIQIAYSMTKNCEMILHVWNQTFVFSATGESIARLQREGNKVVMMSGNQEPRTIFLHEKNLDSSTPISIHLDRRNLWRPKMQLLIKGMAVRSISEP